MGSLVDMDEIVVPVAIALAGDQIEPLQLVELLCDLPLNLGALGLNVEN